MSEHMTSPPEREPPKDWWLENACRIAAYRLRNSPYLSANTIPIRDDEPGVMKVDRLELRNKRGYCSLRIPESVAINVHKRMSV
jgi:hypothetical protein